MAEEQLENEHWAFKVIIPHGPLVLLNHPPPVDYNDGGQTLSGPQ